MLGHLPGQNNNSTAEDISDDGSVIVGTASSYLRPQAFRWTEDTGMIGIGDLPGGEFYSEAYGVSANGKVVVGRSGAEDGLVPFRWTLEKGMSRLGDLPGAAVASSAMAASADGSTIIGSAIFDDGHSPFLWTERGGMRKMEDILTKDLGLNLEGWVLYGAMGISADGSTIVGTAFNPGGNFEAFIANIDPVPVPGAVWLLGSGLVGLVGLRKRLIG